MQDAKVFEKQEQSLMEAVSGPEGVLNSSLVSHDGENFIQSILPLR
ncbi:MAG: hypothetical protein LBS65_02150 [Desulfovibrio sp.]|jgi:hypothetical protein|nr:hypothetical protein [Desulfovibrio sp.]